MSGRQLGRKALDTEEMAVFHALERILDDCRRAGFPEPVLSAALHRALHDSAAIEQLSARFAGGKV